MEHSIFEQIPELLTEYGIGGTIGILIGGGYYKWSERKIMKYESTIEELEAKLEQSTQELKEFGEKYYQQLEQAKAEKEAVLERLIEASRR